MTSLLNRFCRVKLWVLLSFGTIWMGCGHLGAQTVCPSAAGGQAAGVATPVVKLTTHGEPRRVLAMGDPGTEQNRRGFEAGTFFKIAGEYHLFITELTGELHESATTLAHWGSPDAIHWTRKSTLFRSAVNRTGDDPRAALWAPVPVFDDELNVWNLFYIGYYSKGGDAGGAYYWDYDGYVARAASTTPGMDGIDGPYKDAGIILRPSFQSDKWEGLQGTDSFYPYRVGSLWMGFYGSARTEHKPVTAWQVGLAANKSLGGAWHRCTALNPSPIEPRFMENPVVTKVDGVYVVIYDIDIEDSASIGYATSIDGVVWSKGERLNVGAEKGTRIRTPMGLVKQSNGRYALMFTAKDLAPKGSDSAKALPRMSSVYLMSVDLKRR